MSAKCKTCETDTMSDRLSERKMRHNRTEARCPVNKYSRNFFITKAFLFESLKVSELLFDIMKIRAIGIFLRICNIVHRHAHEIFSPEIYYFLSGFLSSIRTVQKKTFLKYNIIEEVLFVSICFWVILYWVLSRDMAQSSLESFLSLVCTRKQYLTLFSVDISFKFSTIVCSLLASYSGADMKHQIDTCTLSICCTFLRRYFKLV